MTRPPEANVSEGDEVLFLDGGNHPTHNPTRRSPARIVKAARVWLTVQTADGRSYQMRRDTQTVLNASGYSYGPRFQTYEQDRWYRREAATYAFLREQGIDVRSGSPWRGRETELADLIRAALPTT